MRDGRKQIVEDGYDALVDAYLTWNSRVEVDPRDQMLAAFSVRLEPGSRVLDLGCGSALPSTKALASRFDVTGVDISAAQIDAARRNVPNASFIHADLAEIDFPSGSFDGVTALYVISHLPRDEHGRLFERLSRWLAPGGFLLATFGASDSPDWIGEWLGRPMFFSSYDADTYRRLLVSANFELLVDEVMETIEPEGPIPFLWVLARSRP